MSDILLGIGDVEAAIMGGTLLSAGGSGKARAPKDRVFAERAFALGPVRLISIEAAADDTALLIATGVGAPGGGKNFANPDHSIRAARNLIAAAGMSPGGVIPGHVPGIYGWLLAAALKVPLFDAACNGRGHPTVKMGSLGLSSRPDVMLFQSGVGDQVEITVRGNTLVTSALMRAAAVQNGGLVMAARGPVTAGLVRAAGAMGAISFQLGLGRAILEAGAAAPARIEAALRFSRGQLLVHGTVVANSVSYGEGFDVGTVTVRDAETGKEVALGVCNEFMTAENDGHRVATFPDLIAAMDPRTGEVLAISEMPVGTPAVVFAVSKRDLPMGSGIYDPAIYPDVERALGADLARYALDPNA
jgi:DUF917 family protein